MLIFRLDRLLGIERDMSVKISFVIPAYNESQFIGACLLSIRRRIERLGIEGEIIVIDNGSSDETAALAQENAHQVHSIPRNTVSYARNFGAAKANSELLAFVDGDVELTDLWMDCLMTHHEEMLKKPFFVTGAQCIVPGDGTWIEKYWFSNLKDRYLGGANILTSKSAFSNIGGFDESLTTGEDYDFCLRAIANNDINYHVNSGYQAVHLGFPKDLKSFYRRERWHGKGDVKNITSALKSQVVLIALFYLLCYAAIIVSFIMGFVLLGIIVAIIWATINLMLTKIRFREVPLAAVILNSFLHPIYFFARLASIFT
tara:strand:- start:8883 stop:9830 length:948 start_codon:yes stop_codon:yes gene_type:complete